MQYRKLIKTGAIVIAASLITLSACKRDKTDSTPALTNADDNGGYASDAAKLESTNNDVLNMADLAATSGAANLRTTSTCVTVTNDTTSSPHVLTLNFGTGCTGVDGKLRTGEIIVYYTGRYKDSGSTHTITFNNYTVDGNRVTGSKTVTNEGTNSSGNIWYTVIVNDSIKLADDSLITQTAHRTRTWLTGYATPARDDDSYSIADVAGYTTVLRRANGHVFNIAITSPLTVAVDCANIEAGILDISSTSFTGGDRILDYSYSLGTAGSCDALAQLTIGSHTYVVILR